MYNLYIVIIGDTMKKVLIVIVMIIFTYVCCFDVSDYLDKSIETVYSQKHLPVTVVIDAGHGGADAGTIGVDGTLEKEINLSIALVLYDYLMVSGTNAKLIRDGDYEFYKEGEGRTRSDLYNRLDFVNSIENSVLVSIHQNHFENEAEWGTQIWYSPNDEESRLLADHVLERINSTLQPENQRMNKPSDDSYYILYKASVPSIMIECGFMSNMKENKRLQQEEYQKDLAYCILSGLSGEL